MRFTAKLFGVSSRSWWICFSRMSHGALPPARQPKPPALQTAETSFGSETQVIAPQMIGYFTPRNSLPRRMSGVNIDKSFIILLSFSLF